MVISRHFLIALITLLPQLTFGGWIHKTSISARVNGNKSSTEISTTFYQGDKLRVETSGPKSGRTIVIFNGKKTFMCGQFGGTKGCMKMGDVASMTSMVPMNIEYKSFKITPLNKRRKIKGFACRDYRIEWVMEFSGAGVDSKQSHKETSCLTTFLGGESLRKAYLKQLKTIQSKFNFKQMAKAFVKYKSLGGALQSRSVSRSTGSIASGSTETAIKTLSLKSKGLSRALFKRPKGYKWMNMSDMIPKEAFDNLPSQAELGKMKKQRDRLLKRRLAERQRRKKKSFAERTTDDVSQDTKKQLNKSIRGRAQDEVQSALKNAFGF